MENQNEKPILYTDYDEMPKDKRFSPEVLAAFERHEASEVARKGDMTQSGEQRTDKLSLFCKMYGPPCPNAVFDDDQDTIGDRSNGK